MFQSRWGFHPCDYATYRKLKFLHLIYQKAVRLAHAWQRWQRKDPHNRVMRRRIRNDKGQTIGYEPPVPLPEPAICPIYSQKSLEKLHVDKKGNIFRDGFLEERVITWRLPFLSPSARIEAKKRSTVPWNKMSGGTCFANCKSTMAL